MFFCYNKENNPCYLQPITFQTCAETHHLHLHISQLDLRFHSKKIRLQELWEIVDTRKGTIVYCFQNGWPMILSMIQF